MAQCAHQRPGGIGHALSELSLISNTTADPESNVGHHCPGNHSTKALRGEHKMNTERAAAGRDVGDGLRPEWLVGKQPGHLINDDNEARPVLLRVKIGPVGAPCQLQNPLSPGHLGAQAAKRSRARLGC
jgi:hypothetical protein